MGLFSSSTKTYVAATTMSMIEDTPDLVKSSVTTAIIKGRDIGPDIVGNYLNGIYIKSQRYFSYGRDSYTYGLPNSARSVLKTQDYIVQPIIEDEVGFKISIVSNVVDVCDADYFAYPWLVANRSFDQDSGLVGNPPLHDGSAVGSDVYFYSADTNGENSIRITYTYIKEETNEYYSEVVPISGVSPREYYYHVVYTERGKTEPRMYWNYRASDGTHPTLDLKPEQDLESPYYPVVPVREHNVDLTEDQDTDFYKTASYLLNIIGIDMDEVAEGINENPDVGDIDHVYIIMGVSLNSDKQMSLRYMHDYFTYLWGINPYLKSSYDIWNAGNKKTPPPAEKIVIKDANYNIELGYSYITNETKSGSVGDIGFTTRSVHINSKHESDNYATEQSYLVFRKQLDETTYSETIVFGLMHINYIYGSYTVDTTIADAFNDTDNENFVIPLNYGVVRSMGLTKANELMYDAIHVVFNSVERVKLKWYQSGFFQFVTIVVAIAITILTYQPGALTASIVGASATVGLSTLALVMTDIVLSFAIKKAIALVAEIVAPELAYALTIIAAAYSIGSLAATGSVGGLPFASETLGVTNQVFAASLEHASEELAIEQAEFEAYSEELVSDLEEKWEDLQPQKDLDPMELFVSFGSDSYFQTPDAYIYQSIHAGNIGATTLESIHGYVDNTLTLPSLSNSLGVNINL